MLNISPLGVCLRNIIALGVVACLQDSPGPGENLPEFSILLISLFVCLFFPFIFISWRLIILQYCSGFCHTLT